MKKKIQSGDFKVQIESELAFYFVQESKMPFYFINFYPFISRIRFYNVKIVMTQYQFVLLFFHTLGKFHTIVF